MEEPNNIEELPLPTDVTKEDDRYDVLETFSTADSGKSTFGAASVRFDDDGNPIGVTVADWIDVETRHWNRYDGDHGYNIADDAIDGVISALMAYKRRYQVEEV